MAEQSKSALLTYVKYRHELDSEHSRLCKCLRLILADGIGTQASKQINKLGSFLEILKHHHETENAMLPTVCPDNWQTHFKAHGEIENLATHIRDLAQAENSVSLPDVARLLNILEQHILVMDKDLAAALDG